MRYFKLLGYGCDISIVWARPAIRVCVLKHPSSHTRTTTQVHKLTYTSFPDAELL